MSFHTCCTPFCLKLGEFGDLFVINSFSHRINWLLFIVSVGLDPPENVVRPSNFAAGKANPNVIYHTQVRAWQLSLK